MDYPLLHTAEYATDPYKLDTRAHTMKGSSTIVAGSTCCVAPVCRCRAIGVIGHSLGGHNALFLAVFDSPHQCSRFQLRVQRLRQA